MHCLVQKPQTEEKEKQLQVSACRTIYELSVVGVAIAEYIDV